MNSIKAFFSLALAILFIGLSIYQLVRSWHKVDKNTIYEDMVIKWDARIQPLRDAIPADVQQVGYLDTSVVVGKPNLVDIEEFFLMQYSIAPVVLMTEDITEEKWIIGNFSNDTDFVTWLDINIGTYRFQSFGFGLYLIHNLNK